MDLYSSFLVLMTTQSSLQYSFTFTQSHTHSYSASISSTLLFYEGQFRVQHLARGHFSMQMGKTGDRTADLQVGGQPLYPSATAALETGFFLTNQNHLCILLFRATFCFDVVCAKTIQHVLCSQSETCPHTCWWVRRWQWRVLHRVLQPSHQHTEQLSTWGLHSTEGTNTWFRMVSSFCVCFL